MKQFLFELLDDAVSSDRVVQDINKVLDESDRIVGLDSGPLPVPVNSAMAVISKSCWFTPYPIGFGNHIRVVVAIGGIDQITNGIVIPKICFAKSFYSDVGQLISIDFFKDG